MPNYIRHVVYACGHYATTLVKRNWMGGKKYHEQACYRCRCKARKAKP